MATDLSEIEEEHGFTFGGGPKSSAGIAKHLKCDNPSCDRSRSEAIPVHNNTVLPVVCGGCGTVLHCNHEPAAEPFEEVTGTIGAPVLIHTTRCQHCGTVLSQNSVALAPVAVHDLPAVVAQGLGVQFSQPTES